jgi:hypothetical protein
MRGYDNSRAKIIAPPLFELARVFVRPDHVASRIENANHSILRTAENLRVADCIGGTTRRCFSIFPYWLVCRLCCFIDTKQQLTPALNVLFRNQII